MAKLNLPKKRSVEVDANLWKRGIAFFIDLFIIMLICSPLISVFTSSLPFDSENSDFFTAYSEVNEYLMGNESLLEKLSAVNVLMMLIAFAYFILFEYKLNQTPGKMIFGLHVKTIVKKEKLALWQCFIRNLFILINFIIVVDIFYYLIKNNRLSDQIAKTKVIEVIQG